MADCGPAGGSQAHLSPLSQSLHRREVLPGRFRKEPTSYNSYKLVSYVIEAVSVSYILHPVNLRRPLGRHYEDDVLAQVTARISL